MHDVRDGTRNTAPWRWCRGSVMLSLCGLLLAGCAGMSRPTQDPEITFDGLHRVNARADRLWVRPGATLEGKTKFIPVFAGITYRLDRAGRVEGRELDPQRVERLEETLHEIFIEELTRDAGWELASEPGPGVIALRAWLADVVIEEPPRTSRDRRWVASAGEATLILEIYDSENRKILARAADRGAADNAGGGMTRASLSHRNEVRRMFRNWARQLRRGLDEVKERGTFEIR